MLVVVVVVVEEEDGVEQLILCLRFGDCCCSAAADTCQTATLIALALLIKVLQCPKQANFAQLAVASVAESQHDPD